MNQKEREMAEELFNTTSLVLSDKGEISPIFFIVKDKGLNPLVGAPGMTMQELSTTAVNVAHEMDAEAIILICEQWMVQMRKDDENLKGYLDGSKRPSEHPSSEAYLTLIYMSKIGEAESLIGKVHLSPNGVRFTREIQWIDDAVTNIITPWA